MNPDKITLKNINKLFEYEKLSREIDQCANIDQLREVAKSYIKLYFAQQEVMTDILRGS